MIIILLTLTIVSFTLILLYEHLFEVIHNIPQLCVTSKLLKVVWSLSWGLGGSWSFTSFKSWSSNRGKIGFLKSFTAYFIVGCRCSRYFLVQFYEKMWSYPKYSESKIFSEVLIQRISKSIDSKWIICLI